MEEQMEKRPRKWPVIAGAAAAVALCAYLGLCAWVGNSDKILPNVTVAGVDVSGLTAQEAQVRLEQAVAERGDELAVTLRRGTWSGTLTAAELAPSWDLAAEMARGAGRENFLTQGAKYLGHLVGMSQLVSLPREDEAPALEALLDQADREGGGGVTQISYAVQGDQLSVTKGSTGIVVDREQARSNVLDAMEARMVQTFGGQSETGSDEVELPVSETPPLEPDFEAIHRALYAEAKSAELDPATYQITDHVVGVDFDPAVLRDAYAQAAEGESFSVPLTLTQPKDTKKSLEGKLFRDLLGQGTTTVSGSDNRKHNVKLSAQACNDVILLPGQVFSYNNTTGNRSASKGYLSAPVYSGGASVDEVGGGICQTSSTIYYAVLHTSLEIVERRNHQYNTGYVDPGMDATVYYGSTDFRFKNNTEYPVKLVTQSYDQGGKRRLTVKIYGTNLDGSYAVPKSEVFDLVEPTTKYQADQSVPRGSLVLDRKQNAYTGRSARTYRYLYAADGALLEKQNMGLSKYAMRPHLYHYNPADGDPSTWVNGTPPKPAPAPAPDANAKPGVTPEPGTPDGQLPAPDASQSGQTPDSGAVSQPDHQGEQTPEPDASAGSSASSGSGSQSAQPAA